MKLSASELCSILQGEFLNKKEGQVLKGVSIDSREQDLSGKVFFAIKGRNFDGHDFLKQAAKAGAEVLVVQKKIEQDLEGLSIIKVEDTLKALQNLATDFRKKQKMCVIGITGSTGKTTTKKFCFDLLKTKKQKEVVCSPSSYNNQYGVPLTLLSATEDTRIVIQEIGMNARGEIKFLSELALPDIVTVTQVGNSHVGLIGSKEEIAKEKQAIYTFSPGSLQVFNWDDPLTRAMYVDSKKSLKFSKETRSADVFFQIKEIKKLSLSIEGHIQGVKGKACVPIVGAAHLNNLLAASALALAAGTTPEEIWKRLPTCRQPAARNEWQTLSSGAEVFFDAYNASPESVQAFLDYFLSPVVDRKKLLILGDFAELGQHLESFQKQWAKKLVQNPPDLLWLLGRQARDFSRILKEASYPAEMHVSEHFTESLAQKILPKLNSSISLAFKASRKMQMEKILESIQAL